MLPKESLQQLIELARMRCESAARELGASQSREQEEGARLRLLMAYRADYLARFEAASRTGLENGAWTNYLDFIRKLDAAIEQQRNLLEQCRHTVQQRRGDWHAQDSKKKSFATLERRRHDSEQAGENRREQREQDEFASRSKKKETT